MDYKDYVLYTVHTRYVPMPDHTDNIIEIDIGDEIKVKVTDITTEIDVQNPQTWLIGYNMRTLSNGYFPGNYVDYIRRVKVQLPKLQLPSIPLPLTEKVAITQNSNIDEDNCAVVVSDISLNSNDMNGHIFSIFTSVKPVLCVICNDYIWGKMRTWYRCEKCNICCHKECVNLVSATNVKCTFTPNEIVKPIDQWNVINVLEWMVCINCDRFIEVFKHFKIDGKMLHQLDESSLQSMKIIDEFHQISLLIARDALLGIPSESQNYGKKLPARGELIDTYKSRDFKHPFLLHNFLEIKRCELCLDFLFGIYRQGFQCTDCSFICHRSCMVLDVPPCSTYISRYSSLSYSQFGIPLNKVQFDSIKNAPMILVKCTQELEQRCKFTSESLIKAYRKYIPSERIESIKNIFSSTSDIMSIDLSGYELSTIVGAIKRFLRELPNPVVPELFYDRFVKLADINDVAERGKVLHKYFQEMPAKHKSTLLHISEHISQICQYEKTVEQPLDHLARVFRDIIMRPPWINIIDIVHHTNNIYKVLIILMDEFKISRLLKHDKLPIHISEEESLDQAVWYWGDISREMVNEKMKDTSDGAFLVRKATNKASGEFTLTVKKDGINKLIKIYHKNGRYGFDKNSLAFHSVVSLINHHSTESLSQYNHIFGLQLIKPIEKSDDDISKPNQDIDNCKNDYKELTREFNEKNKQYNKKLELHTKHDENISEDRQTEQALEKVLESLLDQKKLLYHSFKDSNSDEKGKLRKNELLLESVIDKCTIDCKQTKDNLQKKIIEKKKYVYEMKLLMADIQRLNNLINSLKITLEKNGMSIRDIENVTNEKVLTYNEQFTETHYPIECDSNKATVILRGQQDGTFLIRFSYSGVSKICLSVVAKGDIYHCYIFHRDGKYGFEKDITHDSLSAFVAHYGDHSLEAYSPLLKVKLSTPVILPEDEYITRQDMSREPVYHNIIDEEYMTCP